MNQFLGKMKNLDQFLDEAQSAKCPKGYRYDAKIKSCVPSKRFKYYPSFGGRYYRGGDNRSDSGNGNGGNGNGSNGGNGNGNGGNGNGGGNGGSNGGGGNGGGGE